MLLSTNGYCKIDYITCGWTFCHYDYIGCSIFKYSKQQIHKWSSQYRPQNQRRWQQVCIAYLRIHMLPWTFHSVMNKLPRAPAESDSRRCRFQSSQETGHSCQLSSSSLRCSILLSRSLSVILDHGDLLHCLLCSSLLGESGEGNAVDNGSSSHVYSSYFYTISTCWFRGHLYIICDDHLYIMATWV